MSRVEFKEVTKIFEPDTCALNDFSLTIRDGEFMVLVGPSGCGKSTALRLLAGLEQCSSGEVCINGQRVNEQTPQERNVAMVFQNYSLYPHMNVRKNLEFPLKVRGYDRDQIRKRVVEAERILSLGELMNRKPAQLSGGQSQRVAMGRAIVREPTVFLMDEPLSNLDAKLRVQIRRDIVSLQQNMGTTTLYVTHDQVEAMTLGHRVAILSGGELQQVASPATLYNRPANIFVADFIGTPGMNLFQTHLGRTADGLPGIYWNSTVLPLPRQLNKVLDPAGMQPGDALICGLRPESFRLPKMTEAATGQVEITITGRELLGHETLLYFSSPKSTVAEPTETLQQHVMAARLPGNLHQLPEKILLAPDLTQLHLFNLQGVRLESHPEHSSLS
ncbi:ABC transporter ATP-binding protein [Desulfosediminicola ganghwensis]|uniref:ABC transporter ATP-binding protein n=1 Tax=Desulfosediminicola ganghwensis TaxID=2569540 RepID=UPI0010AD7638|nr:ATP-binding cassette domain-containing protein [Desulfosediminicola ganghwensis]